MRRRSFRNDRANYPRELVQPLRVSAAGRSSQGTHAERASGVLPLETAQFLAVLTLQE